ncbi:MAG TPA: rhomboid family intramembrane serine protease [Myxococcota bacterium]|nr:rhomboid family intramembrane serine protease [Myxococcota bacterium]
MIRRLSLEALPTPAMRTITAINALVFLGWLWAFASGRREVAWMTANFTVSVGTLERGHVWTLLTSAVSHATFAHILFNMLALWTFGADVERLVGSRGFLHLYVAGSILSSLGHVAYTAATGQDIPALGASGAVMAVAVVSALMYPNRRLIVMFIVPMSALTAVGLFVLMDLAGVAFAAQDGVAHGAHLGGALYGLLYYRFTLRGYIVDRLEALGYLPPRAWVEHTRRREP